MSDREIVRVTFDMKKFSSGISRPENTTQYAANEAVSSNAGNDFEWKGVAPINNGWFSGDIVGAVLHSNQNNTTLKLDGAMFIFSNQVAHIADNAAFAPTDAEMRTCLGVIYFSAANWIAGLDTAGVNGNSLCIGEPSGYSFRTDLPFAVNAVGNASASLYGLLKTLNAYTPISAEVLTCDLIIRGNP